MEYCSCGSIRDIINASGKPISEMAISYICSEALLGLQYLHQRNRIHRDIKSGNILLW